MTQIQRAYWIGRSEGFALGGVGSYWYWEFDGSDVDLERLEEAWNRLIARHDMLRVVFGDDGTQKILAEVPRFHIEVTDAGPGSEEEALGSMRAAAGTRQPFDLSQWPLFEIRTVRYGEGRCRLGFGFDYIALDALSIITVFSELETLYSDLSATLPEIGVSFRDYVLSAERQPTASETAREYWTTRIDTMPSAPALPVRSATGAKSTEFSRRETRLAAVEWQRIKDRARSYNLTANTILAAAYAEIVSAWSGGQGITLNFTLFDRQNVHPDIQRVVGDFTSLLLVPYEPQAGEPWIATARRLQKEVWSGLEHHSVSAIWVMRELAARRGLSSAFMPVVFTSTLGVADDLAQLSYSFGSYAGGVSQTPQVYLDNQVVENNNQLLINWDAIDHLFPPRLLDSMFSAYRSLLDWLSHPHTDWLSPIPDLLPPEQRDLRLRVNDTFSEESGRLLHQAFFEHAQREPERAAILFSDSQQMSYADVAEQALRVSALLKARGVGAGDAVAVSLAKGPSQIIAVLGVLSIGAAYVPVSIEQPAARRLRIYENAGVKVVVDEELMEESKSYQPLRELIKTSNEGLAYIIYTSGSTGEPKGVEVTHRAAINTIEAINDRYKVNSQDRILGLSSLEFDLSVYDIFGMLSAGGAVVCLGEGERKEARRWREQIERWGVTIWNSVPVLLEMLLTAANDCLIESLRLVLVGGDWVKVDLPEKLLEQAKGCRFVALGGATEAAIHSTACEVSQLNPAWRAVPYGVPLRNVRCRVVDARGRDCPDWVTGELWIGGISLASGYRANPLATASRFIEYQGQRWYKTGDLGRYWPDGMLEFLGRADDQVKIQGHRIELGEIESALLSHPLVQSAVALTYGNGAQRLGAVVTGSVNQTEQLREYVSKQLPVYMVPNRIVVLEELPLNANGKVDRKRLLEIVASDKGQDGALYEAPKGEMEERLAKLWAELLGREKISRHDNFFALGGDSLIATRLAQEALPRLGLEIPLRAIFLSRTLADLAAFIEQVENETETGVIA
jgi:amino acid adenylation domain-containing protein